MVWHFKGPSGRYCLEKLKQQREGDNPHENAAKNREEKKKNPESWKHRPVTRLAEDTTHG